jgi:hypothetical protein
MAYEYYPNTHHVMLFSHHNNFSVLARVEALCSKLSYLKNEHIQCFHGKRRELIKDMKGAKENKSGDV